MRRIISLLAAVVLTASLAGSSLAADAKPALGFTGNFAELDADGNVLGMINARLSVPTDQDLVPGEFSFVGAPGYFVREAHTIIAGTGYWFDKGHEGGANVAYADGVECTYTGVGDTDCHEWAVMFIDPLDRTRPNQVAFSHVRDASGAFDFDEATGQARWFNVGAGAFEMRGTFPEG